MTRRLRLALEALQAERRHVHTSDLIFRVRDNAKRHFDTVRKAAGLPEVRFHDLRHTAATRLVGAHMPLAEVGRILGHTQANTTNRYVNANEETARRAAALLDAFNAVEVFDSSLVQ